MRLFFLLPLTIGIGALFISRKSASKVTPIADLVAVTSLLVSLVSAPWELQLAILAIAIGSTRFLFRSPANSEDAGADPDLVTDAAPAGSDGVEIATTKYRGVSYTPASSDAVSASGFGEEKGAIAGKYRGTTWSASPTQSVPDPHPHVALKYRGIRIPASKTPSSQTQDFSADSNANT